MPSTDIRRFWWWHIGPPNPPLTDAMLVGVAMRASVHAVAKKLGVERLPPRFHDSGQGGGHLHAHYLSDDSDGDGCIDRGLIFAPSGIGEVVENVLEAVTGFSLAGHRVRLTPASQGSFDGERLIGPAKVWIAATPFVTRLWWHTKTGKPRADFAPRSQIRIELADRARPEPAGIAFLQSMTVGATDCQPEKFAIDPSHDPPPGDAVATCPVLTFPKPVQGPIALGYGAHFGLGLFRPVDALAVPNETPGRR